MAHVFPVTDLRVAAATWLQAAPRLDPTQHYEGPEELAALHAPPRYVWLPVDDTFNGTVDSKGFPRSVATGLEAFSIHCWGATYATTYRLRGNLIVALRKVAKNRVKPAGGRWLLADANGRNVQGRVYILTCHATACVPDGFDGSGQNNGQQVEVTAVDHDGIWVDPADGSEETVC